MALKSAAKFKEKLTCGFENDMKNLVNFYQSNPVSKLGPWWDPFIESRKFMSLKLTEKLCITIIYNDAKFEELTCQFKIDTQFDEFWPEH